MEGHVRDAGCAHSPVIEVDWEIVWKVIRDGLPDLKKAIENALAGET